MTISSTGSSSRRLIRDAQNGQNPDAIDQFANKYWTVVFNWALKHQITAVDAADIAQEVFLRVLPNLSQYSEEKGKFRSWLGKITFNCTMNFFNEQKQDGKQIVHLDPTLLEMLKSSVSNELQIADAEVGEIKSSAFTAIAALKENFDEERWQCFEEMVGFGRTATEIANDLNITPATVRKRKQRILEELKTMLSVENPDC